MPRKIRFAGDHGNYHCGSWAVSKYIRSMLDGDIVTETASEYDVLVVNGEGSMHHNSAGLRKKMRQISECLDIGKPCYLINSVWQENNNEFDESLRSLNRIVVREVMSQQDLERNHKIASDVSLDFSFFCELDHAAEGRNFKGEIAVTDFYSRDIGTFARAVGGYLGKHAYIDMKTIGWSELVAALKTTPLLITGRHHAVYAACKARTPFLALRSNTHKIEGLIESSPADIPIFETLSDAKAKAETILSLRSEFDRLFDWMEEQPPFRLEI